MPSSLPPILCFLLTEEQAGYQETTLRGYRSAWRDLLEELGPYYREELRRALAEEKLREMSSGEELPEDPDLEALVREAEVELPEPEEIAEYLRKKHHLGWSTLTTRRQAIRLVYEQLVGTDPFEHPEVEEIWSRIREEKREEPDRPEKHRLQDRDLGPTEIIEEGPAFLSGHLGERSAGELKYLPEEHVRSENLVEKAKDLVPEPMFDLEVLRARALLLLVGPTDASRNAILGIDIEDIYPPGEEGNTSDDEGAPTRILMYGPMGDPTHVLCLETSPDLKYCPNRAVAAWILATGLTEGPLFRSFTPHGALRDGRIRPQTINRVIKRCAEEAGLDPDDWSTTTLREGLP